MKTVAHKIRFSVGISTFAMGMVLVSSILIVAYYFFSDTVRVRERTVKSVSGVLQQIEDRTQVLTGALFLTLDSIAAVSALSETREGIGLSLRAILAPVLIQNPSITSAYVGYADGEFTQIVSFVDKDPEVRAPYRASKDAAFGYVRVVRGLDGTAQRVVQPVSVTGRDVGEPWQEPTDFDPRKRPWYKPEAAGSTETQYHLTEPYVFAKSRQPGITISRALSGYDAGSAGVDLDLRSLADFIAELKLTPNTRLAIVSPDGLILSHTHLDPVAIENRADGTVELRLRRIGPAEDRVLATLAGLSAAATELEDFTVGSERYLGQAIGVDLGGTEDFRLLIAVPWLEIAAPLYEARNLALGAASAFAALVMIVAIFVGRWLARPIERLTGEAEAIGHLELGRDMAVSSPFTEIQQLSDAMGTMKSAIGVFARYVPRGLVAQLVESGTGAELGGTRRDLVIMFSDIESFTTITEKSSSATMMRQLSDYFEGQSNAILRHNGTIDKYIGDAVMAFWNAPRDDLEMASNACKAVLRAADTLATLNVRWDIEGRPALETRYGLHLGNVVVGNVGCSERMNYTAMGAAVNIAARLEGLNKFFGTMILVSDAVRRRTGNAFVWRTVGLVNPKGVTTPVLVHELVGLNKSQPDMADMKLVAPAPKAKAAEWNAIFELYLKGQWRDCRPLIDDFLKRYPDDRIASYYSERCDHFIEHPPTGAWAGAEEFETK